MHGVIISFFLAVNRHVPVASVKFDAPQIENAFVAPSGLVLGKVSMGEGSSVWYNATVRGDYGSVTIGKNTNIQDSAYVGATSEFSPSVFIGENVSVGHGAVLKGCTVGSNTLIGINAVVSEGAQVRRISSRECPPGNPLDADFLRRLGRVASSQQEPMLRRMPLSHQTKSGRATRPGS